MATDQPGALGDLGRTRVSLTEQHIALGSQELPACQTMPVQQWIDTEIESDDALHPAWRRIDAADTDDDLGRQARMILAGLADRRPGPPLFLIGLLAHMQAIREHLRDAKLRALQDRMARLTEQIRPPLVHEIHDFADDNTDSNRKLAEAAAVSHTENGRWLNSPLSVSLPAPPRARPEPR
ncbi:hypothetical protein [Kutzneria buriramensis]|uniref:Uncharacterized protein n=1 Tax=Kutzneria buriramensis TaxID=1045776 RepID=A0A3E0HLG7_9PSEU|nr:hypothetical protein [Kutzneria buriramensis]REH47299.1 hypothetical protein BCF44_106464 [Kutzneria buriramensis]